MNYETRNQRNSYHTIVGRKMLDPSNKGKTRCEILIEAKKSYRDTRRKALIMFNRLASKKNRWEPVNNPYLDDTQ